MAAILKSNMADIERIPSGPISENVRNMLMYICAKFGACITKCTILLNIWSKPPHYLSEFYPQDGDESQLALKLCHCHPMYAVFTNFTLTSRAWL